MTDDGPEALARALSGHPAVADCRVGADASGRLRAEVVLRPGGKVTAEELARHARDRLGVVPGPVSFVLRPAAPAGATPKADGAA